MPYFITNESAECDGWAVVKQDGEVMGCHGSKQDAVDQMVAMSLAEDIEPGGERVKVQVKRSLPTGYRPADSEDVPAGRACGNCEHYSDDIATPDGTGVWCELWEDWVRGDHYCDQWMSEESEGMEDSPDDFEDAGYKEDDEDKRGGTIKKEKLMDDKEFRFDAPRENLVRKVEFRAEPSSDGLTLEGYAAVFNEWTQIDSYEGTFQERIAPGAFKKTISERMPVLQFDHGTHPLIGSIPLGVITSLREDAHGLKVKARLSDNWLVEPVRDAIRDGAIQGMSFRFRVINDKWTRGKNGPERTINEIALYEAGPVVFPAYEQTSVGVRSREVLTSLSDPEVRGEIAKLLAFGTDPSVVETTEEVEPQEHSIRTQAQRQALARLTLEKDSHEHS
jgi:HK97 family phage prohead protease